MSEHDRKNYGDNDSIKTMLERLRRSVTDLPPLEEKETETGVETPAAADASAQEKPKIPMQAEEQGIARDEATAQLESDEEEMVLLPWEEDAPFAEEEQTDSDEFKEGKMTEDESNTTTAATEAVRVETELEGDEAEEPFFTADIDDDALAEFFEPIAADNETSREEGTKDASAEGAEADALPQGFVDVADTADPVREEAPAVPAVTDDEAALLFRAKEEQWEPPTAPKVLFDERTNEVDANEDNGYAVEVEVHRPARNVTSPWAALQENTTAEVKEENDRKTVADRDDGPAGAISAAASENATSAQAKGGATPGLSNGLTRWHDNGARRRPVEVLETSDIEEQEPSAPVYKTARKSKGIEKKIEEPSAPRAADAASTTAPDQAPTNDQTTGRDRAAATKPFTPGVQLTIDDVKQEKTEKTRFLTRLQKRLFSKPSAEKEMAPPSRSLPPQDRAGRGAARQEEREDVLSDLYREEAAAYNEYTSHNQMGLFRRKFESELSLVALRVGILTFLATFLLILENGLGWGLPLERVFLTPVSMAALHLLLLFFALLCSIPLFARAWRQLFSARIVSELFVAVGLLCAIVYSAALCFSLVVGAGEGMPHTAVHLFGFLPVLAALVATITESQKAKNDLASFSLISSAGDKLACTVKTGGSTTAESAAIADLQEGEQTRIVSVKKVGFTSGFFYRVTRNCEDERKNLWLLPMAAIAAFLVALLVGFLESDLLGACYAFCIIFSLALPLCTLVLHKLPVSILFRYAASLSCAVVGEVSAIEYSDADAFAFEDVEAFSARGVRVQRIKLYNESALDRVMYQVANTFSLVGGPLDGVFRNSTAELGLSSDLCLQQVLEGGLIAGVDGRRICVGSGDFMLKQKIRMYYDAEDEQILANGKTCIMYAAEDGKLSAKFYIRYRMDEAFERDVERLAAKNIRVLIRTFDPNIRKVLIDKISYTGRYDVRVVRKTMEQQHDYAAPQANSGIVTRRSVREIVRVLLACRRACRLTAFSERGGLVVGCTGMLLSVLLAALGLMLSAPTWLLAVYQLLWILPVWLASTLYITRK